MAGPFQAGHGVVASFDDDQGTGVVRDADGAEWPFHCTAIANGTRTIDPGTDILFRVAAGHHGRWEATEVVSSGNRRFPDED